MSLSAAVARSVVRHLNSFPDACYGIGWREVRSAAVRSAVVACERAPLANFGELVSDALDAFDAIVGGYAS